MDRSRSPAYGRAPSPSRTPASWHLGPSSIFAAWKLSRHHEANRNVRYLAHGCVQIIAKTLRMQTQIDRLRLVAKPGCTHVSLRLSLSLIVCLMSVCCNRLCANYPISLAWWYACIQGSRPCCSTRKVSRQSFGTGSSLLKHCCCELWYILVWLLNGSVASAK